MRRFKNDVVEVFAGMANITAEALSRQLRAIQPIDAVHGIRLDVKEDFKKLTQLLVDRCPFLVVWEIRCDPCSNIQHLNYTAEELASIRESQYESIKGTCDSISFLKTHYGVHFLLENPWGTPFWKHPEIVKLMNLENVKLAKGSMCNFGLVGRNGHFLKKDTGWLSDLSEVLNYVAKPCEMKNVLVVMRRELRSIPDSWQKLSSMAWWMHLSIMVMKGGFLKKAFSVSIGRVVQTMAITLL